MILQKLNFIVNKIYSYALLIRLKKRLFKNINKKYNFLIDSCIFLSFRLIGCIKIRAGAIEKRKISKEGYYTTIDSQMNNRIIFAT